MVWTVMYKCYESEHILLNSCLRIKKMKIYCADFSYLFIVHVPYMALSEKISISILRSNPTKIQ